MTASTTTGRPAWRASSRSEVPTAKSARPEATSSAVSTAGPPSRRTTSSPASR
ncbi:MAG: hypothetical protein NVV74_15210 [Magnetospirillum sp.]|nr:hypothetical protein [Magnetospirillum sp.]